MFAHRLTLILVLNCCSLTPLPAQNNGDECFFLCLPELKIEPTFTVENIFTRHRIAELDGDEQVGVSRAEREVVFEAILALDVPTSIPRVGFTFETIFIPLASGDENPYIELEGSLDYVATGLPRAGDRIGNELFLTRASPWSFSLVFVIPLAPRRP